MAVESDGIHLLYISLDFLESFEVLPLLGHDILGALLPVRGSLRLAPSASPILGLLGRVSSLKRGLPVWLDERGLPLWLFYLPFSDGP